MKIELQYGAMTEPLKIQLEDQGITVNDVKLINKMQVKADMITKLYLSDLLTERESNKAHYRLHKQIISHLISSKEIMSIFDLEYLKSLLPLYIIIGIIALIIIIVSIIILVVILK